LHNGLDVIVTADSGINDQLININTFIRELNVF